MRASHGVVVVGLTFTLGTAGCGSVTLTPDAGGAAGGMVSAGRAGTSGEGGTTGPGGTMGTAGAAGHAGTTGTAGAAGTTGSAGATGHAGTAGTAGAAGHAGTTGTAGAAGTTGSAGVTGHAGAGGTADGGVCACPANYGPVCGADGKTYANTCEADCAGVTVAHMGECTDAGTSTAVTLKVTVPADKPYCDQTMACTSPGHFQILTAAGQPIAFNTPPCPTSCSPSCQPLACPLVCIPTHGMMFTGSQINWDGSYYTTSTCGMNFGCYQKQQAAAGRYIARLCGTPGTLDNPDAGFQANCVASGPQVCVDVPFDYPSPTPVEGHLP